jgi:hypothetical protein
MPITRPLGHEVEFAVQKESGGYGVDPGAVGAGDFFVHQAGPDAIKRVIARFDRDKDARYNSHSVITTQKGRESSTWSLSMLFCPSGVASAPTEPDIDAFLEAWISSKHKATAHTTTRAGSAGVAICLAAGGGAASGLAAKDMFSVDVDGAGAYEVRQVVSLGAAVSATAAIGAGVDGVVTTTVDAAGTAGNTWTIEVVAGVGLNVALSANTVGTDITVTLGTDGAGALDPTKNTATLVAGVITALALVTAAASGTGATPLAAPEGPTTFTGGLGIGDNLTVDRAFTSGPAAGRTVKVGTTYLLSASADLISLTLKQFIDGETRKRKTTGNSVSDGELKIALGEKTPVLTVTLSGAGQADEALGDARPASPTTAGQPLVPDNVRVWIGTGAAPDEFTLAGDLSLTFNNGIVLCENEGGSLEPSRLKRTGNDGNYMVGMSLGLYGTEGDEDTLALFDDAQTLTAKDVLVQVGRDPGAILAWRCPAFKSEPSLTKLEGEVGINYGGGRCYGILGDDELTLYVG